jgi:uncharacterized protein YlxP (DUF503 family)
MHVAALRLELVFVPALTARQKRRLLHSMSRSLRKNFNIALYEVGDETRPSAASLGLVSVHKSRKGAHDVLERVAELLEAHPRARVLSRTLVDL